MERQGKVTGAEEKRAAGKRGDGRKESDGQWEGDGRGGAERQKVRNRGVLMAVCRAGLLGIQGVVGAEGLLCVCVADVCGEVWME